MRARHSVRLQCADRRECETRFVVVLQDLGWVTARGVRGDLERGARNNCGLDSRPCGEIEKGGIPQNLGLLPTRSPTRSGAQAVLLRRGLDLVQSPKVTATNSVKRKIY